MKTLITIILITLSFCVSLDARSQSGCMDQLACNFDPIAIIDDGSCDYHNGDFNCSNVSDAIDYLIFMENFGCQILPDEADVQKRRCDSNLNGFVDITDLIIFISAYGNYSVNQN